MSDQAARFSELAVRYNAQMTGPQIRRLCCLICSAKATLGQSIIELGFRARTQDKILRVSQTIADMVDAPMIETKHIYKVVNYRLWIAAIGIVNHRP